MGFTDNPVADFERYDAELEEALTLLPVCIICGEHIQDDYLYEIDGDIYCVHCLNEYFRKDVMDYIG